MASPKRLCPWSGSRDDSDDAGQLSRPCKRWRSLVMQVRGSRTMDQGVFGFSGIIGGDLMTLFQPLFSNMVQRVVSEEVGKAISRHFNAAAAAPPRLLVGWKQRPRYQLMFLNVLKPVYTMMKLEAKDGSALQVAIVENLDNDQTRIVRFGHLSSVRAEVVVLHGNFNAKNEECWTPEEFNKHIVWGREKSAKLLNGDLTLKLSGGEAFLENANFTDNSSFTSTKKFRLGLRLVNAYGERVLEGITEPFRVKERRVEGFEKHHPPLLGDEVWRLERIGKNGAYHQALSDSGIDTVQKLLQSYMKNEQKLLKTFTKMSPAAWKAIIGHAMTCAVGDDLYLYEIKENNMGFFFDAILQLVGVKFGNCYKPLDQVHQVEKSFSGGSLASTDTYTAQPHFQLTSNRDSFSNQPDLLYNGQTLMQPHQVVTSFQPSRTNSFDSVENDQLIHSFMSKILSSKGATAPLSPRKWVKIKAALKLASVGRLSRASRRGLNSPLGRPRLVPTI
uniref:Uncharacterized protein n=1 Tax=Avena sativa TaxID=4498 RepID=A0ACD5XMT0_AVESA